MEPALPAGRCKIVVMPGSKAQISTWSNNSLLEEIFHGYSLTSGIIFTKNKEVSAPYHLFLIDLSQDLSDVSQKLITVYKNCLENNQKLAVVLIHPYQIDTEKNLYFTQLLDGLGNGHPLHRLVFVKDLFQSSLPNPVTWLDSFVLEAVASRKVNISSKGKNYLYPLSTNDLVGALLKVLFLSGTAGKTFWLVGDPIPDLEFAYFLKKSLEDFEGPSFEIEATGENLVFGLDLNSQGNSSRAFLNWKPEEDTSIVLKDFIHRLGEDQGTLISNLHKTPSRHRPYMATLFSLRHKLEKFIEKRQKGTLSSFENGPLILKKALENLVGVIVFIYFCATLSFIGFTGLSLKLLETSISDLRTGNVTGSVQKLNQSIFYSEIGETSYSFVSPLISLIAPNVHSKNYNLFTFEHYSQTSLGNLQQTYSLADKILHSINDPSMSLNYVDASLALRSNLIQTYENLNQIEILSESGKLPLVLEKKIKTNPEFNNLKQIEDQILQLTKIIDLIPSLLAGDTVKNIVVLFQNSHELRSTGGTLDFFLVLSLDHGRVVSHHLYQDSEINSLTADLIPAPPLIKLFSGSDDWKLRDMNYNPDFPQTAENLSWFFDKVLKFKPDVIVAANDHLILNLLDQDKNIQINDTSIASSDLEKDLSLSSSSLLYRQLVETYLNKFLQHEISLLTTGRVLAKEIGENQLFFWTRDSSVEQTILDQPYSGSVIPHICHPSLHFTRLCLSQTTYLNESNFSLVPVNHDLNRQVTHKVWLEEGNIRHEYLVDYQFIKNTPNLNRALTEAIQLYTPVGSVLDEVTLDAEVVPFRTISKQTDRNLDRFQIPISFSFNVDHHLSIKFSTPLVEPALLPIAYSLTEYRQPGLVGHNVKLQINYPENARPAAITAPVITGVNNIVYDYPLRTATFGVNFIPKPL